MVKEQVVGLAQDAGKASPPTAAVVAYLAGYTLADWLVVVTIAYTVLMFVHRVWHWRTPPKGK